MNEIWKKCPIEEFKDFYEVSSLGKIRSVDREINYKNNRKYYYKGKDIKVKIDKDGYGYVQLYKNQHSKKFLIHRLVALAFIPNPNDLPIINHKDCIRNNNIVSNLEWCSFSYNTKYGIEKGNIKIGDEHSNAIKLILMKDNEIISYYSCRDKLSQELKCSTSYMKIFIGKDKKIFDTFTIKKVNEIPTNAEFINKNLNFNEFTGTFSPIKLIDINNNIIGIYNNLSLCAEINNFNFLTIQKRSQDKGLYKKKYFIQKISKYEFLTCNKNLINTKINT